MGLNKVFNELSAAPQYPSTKPYQTDLNYFSASAPAPPGIFPSYTSGGEASNMNTRETDTGKVYTFYFNNDKSGSPVPPEINATAQDFVNAVGSLVKRNGGKI
jgi:hypothetical protein